MYGLTTSPRDWGHHRDRRIPKMVRRRILDGNDRVGRFRPTGDSNLWRLEEVDKDGTVHWVGLLGIYVDDVFFMGEPEAIQQAFSAVEKEWTTSGLEWVVVRSRSSSLVLR